MAHEEARHARPQGESCQRNGPGMLCSLFHVAESFEHQRSQSACFNRASVAVAQESKLDSLPPLHVFVLVLRLIPQGWHLVFCLFLHLSFRTEGPLPKLSFIPLLRSGWIVCLSDSESLSSLQRTCKSRLVHPSFAQPPWVAAFVPLDREQGSRLQIHRRLLHLLHL